MYMTLEDKQKGETEVLERFLSEYEECKKYVESATDEEKLTPLYRHRKNIVEGVDTIYPTLNDDLKKIIKMRYWYKDYKSDWADIADELYMKVSKVRRLRDVIIRKFAEAIGWV
ncbi:hypothetical protein M5J14_19455 [Lysinibacillus sp. OL1_EC]|uniref:hypothetical protein n=1 Tax=unclassified Lysinibacillus TaxID=2636778 RepID=UPI00103CEC16|nr:MULTISPECIES: hypothetical protein [unclassified Lysinibacillus]MCM0626679.1 hypothetical protein [Lysinibacillus sp. OL1_EC]TBV89155.1 hypothetical protein EW028_06965 [Lysinibacillus sp. OL1]